MASSNQKWNGQVWIKDNWTDEERHQALDILAASRLNGANKDLTRNSSSNGDAAISKANEPKHKSDDQEQQRALSVFRRNAGTNWNVFYEQNTNKFFKDRHYLHKAFPLEFGWLYHSQSDENYGCVDEAETCQDGNNDATEGDVINTYSCQQSLNHWRKNEVVTIVEIGCGVGNAILPLFEQHSVQIKQSDGNLALPQLHIHCLDFAPNAIEILKQDQRFQSAAGKGCATAHVYDLSSMHPSTISISADKSGTANSHPQTLANSADVAILLFCLSAIGPHPSPALNRAARHVMDMLKPGGILVIRDYGRLDEAQLKLGKNNKELGENFYQKGDGTGCYYFELNDLRELFGNGSDKLNVLELDYIQRVYRNRGDGTTRRRVWVQGRFRKPLNCQAIVSGMGENNLLMDEFLRTSIQRWDSHYKIQKHESMSLEEAISSKYSNNLLQLFPDEFSQWQRLLGSSHGKAKENPSSNTQAAITVIDVGCGTGNGTLLNIMTKQQMIQADLSEIQEQNNLGLQSETPQLNTHFIDASEEAIKRLCNDPRYRFIGSGSNSCISSAVLDITSSEIPAATTEELSSSVDMALLVFTLSAIGPYQHKQSSRLRHALKNIASMLKPGGVVLFRDFGRYDDDQLQLNSCFGCQICENFYFRDDTTPRSNTNGRKPSAESKGVAVYFFDLEEVRELFIASGFEVMQLDYIKRPYSKSGKNGKNVSMNGGAVKRTRIWIHGRFRKKD